MRSIGAHTQDGTISTATVVTVPKGATILRISVVTQAVHYTLDGTTPTATLGFPLAAASTTDLDVSPGQKFTVIEDAVTAVIDYQFFGPALG